jgi:peptide/nickel transport system substrate-binding protein
MRYLEKVCCMLVLVLLLCSFSLAQAEDQELVIGVEAMNNGIEPFFDTGTIAAAIYRLMFETLVTVDEEGSPQPLLAESWKVLDSLTWQFKLRKGVRFHNGKDLTSKDIKYSLDWQLIPENKASWRTRFALISKTEIIDEYTINIITEKPWARLLQGLLMVFVMPENYYDQPEKFSPKDQPVGTGKYKFARWKVDNFITLEANQNYWGKKSTVPQVTYKEIPEASTRLAALEAREIHIANNVPPDLVDVLKEKKLIISSAPIGAVYGVNLVSVKGGPLADKRVRQAINYAVDKKAIVDALWAGYARVLDGQLVGPDGFGYNPDLKPYPFDPNKARQLLTEAGYSKGFTVDMNGVVGHPKSKEVCEALVAFLSDVGIKVKLEIIEWAIYIKGIHANSLANMLAMRWQYLPAMDSMLAYAWFQSPGASTIHITSNKQFDELFAKADNEFGVEKRLLILKELATVFREEAPFLPLYQLPAIYGVDPKLKNIRFLADESIDFSNANWGK